MFTESGLEGRISKLGVTEADLDPMAEEVVVSIGRLIATNPRDMSRAEVRDLYAAIF